MIETMKERLLREKNVRLTKKFNQWLWAIVALYCIIDLAMIIAHSTGHPLLTTTFFAMLNVLIMVLALYCFTKCSGVLDKKKKAKRFVIAFAGEKKCGKDTAASFLAKSGYYHTLFARALKDVVAHAFTLSYAEVDDQKHKERPFVKPIECSLSHCWTMLSRAKKWFPRKITRDEERKFIEAMEGKIFATPRKILQIVGTEGFRDCVDEDFWAKCLEKELDDKKVEKAVISDCRFENERIAVRDWWGGFNILIDRPEDSKVKDGHSNHRSETSLGSWEDYHYVLVNHKKGFDEFERQVKNTSMMCRVRKLYETGVCAK